jgi:hypothetical protein
MALGKEPNYGSVESGTGTVVLYIYGFELLILNFVC